MIQQAGGAAASVQFDVADYTDVQEVFKKILDSEGRIDILINNAGITRDGLLARMQEDAWDAVLSTNLKGAFNCIKAVTRPMMKQKWGRIINISSVVGFSGNPGQVNYSAAKAGLVGLTKSASRELASRGITVNGVAPGYIETDMTANLSDEITQKMLSEIPLGTLGKPEDVAGAVAFLADEESSYITGQFIHVNGGLYM
jgi:3-oxoacyl-[acyl-carrier protein] reductase